MGNFTYVANNVHRIHIVDTNASKYTEHYLWIANELSEHWRLGFSLTMEQLRQSISNKFFSFNDMKRSTYCQWVARDVKRAGFFLIGRSQLHRGSLQIGKTCLCWVQKKLGMYSKM